MINLLPPANKREIRAGRTNVLLVRYIMLLMCAVIFLVGANAVTYYYLTVTKNAAQTTIDENAEKEGSYAATKAEAATFRANLADAKSIFDKQISYSKAMLVLSNLIPNGAALGDLKLTEASFGSPIHLSFNLTGESAAKQLLDNLKGSQFIVPGTVTKDSIKINDSGTYPYTMEVTLTIAKEAATR